ncbi:MAG: hypothetical protein AAFV07_19905 [Bacteroidota bacterium]
MKISSIQLKHTQPSLGPHEEITTVSLSVSGETADRVNTFVHTATVNGVVSIAEYLQAVGDKDKKVLAQVQENAPKGELSVGGKISHLTFLLKDGQSIELRDVYRQYAVSDFYPDFTQFMVDKGFIDRYKPWDMHAKNVDDEVMPPPEPQRIQPESSEDLIPPVPPEAPDSETV